MRKAILLFLAAVIAAASPSLAFAGKKHAAKKPAVTQPADPNENTSHLLRDLFMGKK